MNFSGFSNNHLFSFLFKHEEKMFIECFEPILLKKGAKLTIEPANIFYYYIESGNVAVAFENGHRSLVLHAGEGFGRLPFAVTSDCYTVSVLEESLVYRIDDEKMLLFFLSDLKKIRGYLNAVSNHGIEIIKDSVTSGLPDTAVIGVVGEAKSGKTLFSALLAKSLSKTGRVLLVDASRSHMRLSSLFSCNTGIPVVIKEPNQQFDSQKYLVSVSNNISLANFSDGKKIDNAGDLLSALLVHSAFEFDYIVIDGSTAALSEDIIVNSDFIYNICRSSNDKRSAGLWFDRFISEGQRLVHVSNRLFNDEDQGYYVKIEQISNMSEAAFKEIAENIDMSDAVSIIKKNEICFLEPYFYKSLAYATHIANNPNTRYVCSGFSLFFAALFLFYDNQDDFIAKMSDFFCKSRQKLLYKLVYPDERLYSADYFCSYAKKIFGKYRLEDLRIPLTALLSGESGKVNAVSSGKIADLVTAAFSRRPYFNKHYVSGLPLSASYSGRKNIMYRVRGSSYHHLSIDVDNIVYPFKSGTFLNEMIRRRDINSTKGDFIIDLSRLDLYNTQTLFK